MPVMLTGETAWQWLNPEKPLELQQLLKPFPAAEMETYQVRPMVNSPAVDSIELLARVED